MWILSTAVGELVPPASIARRDLINLNSEFLPGSILIVNPARLTINSTDLVVNRRV